MTNLLGILLLACTNLIGLVLVPLGLPGLWLMVLGVLAYGWMTDFQSVDLVTIGIVVGLALVGEVVEAWLGFRFTKKYGGSSRAGWGALIGGLVGAGVGVPVPIIGSVIGAIAGSFVGAVLFEYSASRRAELAITVGWGSVLARAAAAAVKVALGLLIVVASVVAVLRLA